MNAATLGRCGEDLALTLYEAAGFVCRARRWRRGGGEIDLIVERPGLLVFVEVKTRGPGSYGAARECIQPRQLRRLRRLIGRWCHEQPPGAVQLRLDVVTVDFAGPGRGLVLRHYPDAG
jgi:putative endonuclease